MCKAGDYSIFLQMRAMDREVKKSFEKLQMEYVDDKTVATHGWIIGYLYDHQDQDVYQKDLERRFEIAPSTMTTILQSMERVGYVKRVSVSHDARLKRIALTEEGIQFHYNAVENFKILEARMIEGIPEEDVATFNQVISQIIENLKTKS